MEEYNKQADALATGNEPIELAISQYCKGNTRESLIMVLEAIRMRMNADGRFLIPVELPEAVLKQFDPQKLQAGDVVQAQEDMHLAMRKLQLSDGQEALVAFTCEAEVDKGERTSMVSHFIQSVLESIQAMDGIAGIVINPWGDGFFLSKELIQMLFDVNRKMTPHNEIFLDIGDITKLDCQCIVNAANKSLLGGGGVDGAIHRAAGPELLAECRTLNGCETGEAKLTKGYKLKAQYVIHTVGPIYSGTEQDADLLSSCYRNSLELAKEHGIHSIAFPAISTGVYGYPQKDAAQIALKTIAEWFEANPKYGMTVVLSCFNQKIFDIYQENYVPYA